MRIKLTDRTASQAEPVTSGQQLFWDTEQPGLGLRLTSGSASWILQYTSNDGRRRRITLGPAGEGGLTLAAAKKLAAKERLKVISGADPAQDRRAAREAPTVKALADRFEAQHSPKLKPSTAAAYAQLWKRHILPRFGSRRLSDVSSGDIARFHDALRDRPTTANRALALLRKAFNLAVRWNMLPDGLRNPAVGHDPHRERRPGRSPSSEQLAALGRALREDGESVPRAAFLFAMLTGCRPGEALGLRWEHLEGVGGSLWRLADAKTGPRTVFLGAAARQVLAGLPHETSGWCFPGVKDRHLASCRALWLRVRSVAGLDGFRPYDATRHGFVTMASELGIPRERVKLLAGHAPGTDVTTRYEHVRPAVLLADADRVSRELARLLGFRELLGEELEQEEGVERLTA